MNTPTHVIETDSLVKSYGSVKAANGISLSIPRQSLFGILGPNGAGKTTLFSLIAGFVQPDSGTISVLGEKGTARARGGIGILPQDARFQLDIPILDQLVWFMRLSGADGKTAYDEVIRVLDLVELSDRANSFSGGFSHGMYKRLCLAQAFLGKPQIVILDEPTEGLDVSGAKKIREYIKALKENDTTVIVASHNLSEMHELCDHIAVLDSGNLLRSGPVSEVLENVPAVVYTLSSPLSDEARSKCLSAGLTALEPAGYLKWRATFPRGKTDAETNEIRSLAMRAILESGNTIVQAMEENRLEGFYLKTLDTDKPES